MPPLSHPFRFIFALFFQFFLWAPHIASTHPTLVRTLFAVLVGTLSYVPSVPDILRMTIAFLFSSVQVGFTSLRTAFDLSSWSPPPIPSFSHVAHDIWINDHMLYWLFFIVLFFLKDFFTIFQIIFRRHVARVTRTLARLRLGYCRHSRRIFPARRIAGVRRKPSARCILHFPQLARMIHRRLFPTFPHFHLPPILSYCIHTIIYSTLNAFFLMNMYTIEVV